MKIVRVQATASVLAVQAVAQGNRLLGPISATQGIPHWLVL